MAKYWYDSSSSKIRVNKIKENYEDIVKKAMSIAKTMQEYVCVDGKWYDDNARIVARWWNQSKTGEKSGNLQWTGEKLEIVNPKEGLYDGEDRIKRVVNGAASIINIGIFMSISVLEDSHHEIQEDFVLLKNKPRLWQNKSFASMYDEVESMGQREALEEIGYKKWTKTVLNTASSNGKKSDTEQMNQFISQIDRKLDALEKSWNTFATCVKNTASNDDQSKWWGFDAKTRANVLGMVKTIDQRNETNLASFRKNLYTALSNTLDSKNLNLDKLKG